jgi:integrase
MREFRIGRLNGRFVVSWWDDGKRQRFRLESAVLKDAEREAIDVYRSKSLKTATTTIAHLWEAYRADKDGRRVAAAMFHEWKTIGPHFGHLRPDQIDDRTCLAYTEKRRQTKARNKEGNVQDGSIWTELGHLRSVLKWAVSKRLLTYAPDIPRPSKPAPKERHLTSSECQRLIEAAGTRHIRLAILLLLSTAARIGAVLDLTWERVDFDRNQIRLRLDDSSTRQGRATVPMNSGVRAALQEAYRSGLSDFVVEWGGQQVKSIKTGFNKAVAMAGLENVSPHVLRHTAAVHLAEAGIPMSEISQYLGHEDERITAKVYARFSPGHMQKSADVLDFTSGPKTPPKRARE